MKHLRSGVAAGMLFVAAPVCAQSLQNGEPLQFNTIYHCNGEQMIVGHCRDNDPASYCMVYYPDRTPAHPGYQVSKAETLGAVLANLSACASAASAAAPVSSAPAQTTSAAAPKAAAKPPGLAKTSWRAIAFSDEKGEFYTAAGIKRDGNLGRGWITSAYSDDQKFGPYSGVRFVQRLVEVDCTRKTTRDLQLAGFDEKFKLLANEPQPDPQFQSVQPESFDADELSVLCGTWGKHPGDDPIVGTGDDLWGITRIMMAMPADGAKGKK